MNRHREDSLRSVGRFTIALVLATSIVLAGGVALVQAAAPTADPAKPGKLMNQASGQGAKQGGRAGPQSNDDPDDSMIFSLPKRSAMTQFHTAQSLVKHQRV